MQATRMPVSMHTKPAVSFQKRSCIVIDESPILNSPVDSIPSLRAGVPSDEVGRVGSHFNFSKAFFMSNLIRLVNRFR